MSPSSFLHESHHHPTAVDAAPQDASRPATSMWHHLSRATKTRKRSAVKSAYKYFLIPGISQVAGGLPTPYYFPFDTLEAKVARPDRWEPTPNRPVNPPSIESLSLGHDEPRQTSSPLKQSQDAIAVPFDSQEKNRLKEIDIKTALQYGTCEGYPPLFYFVREFTRNHLHPNCPYKGGPEIILSIGNTDGLAKSLLALSNEWSEEKDWIRDREGILVEKYAFMTSIQQAEARGLNIVPVALDEQGMLVDGPGGLRDVLQNWDHSKGKRPHLMYTITIGQNPTSGILSLDRKRAIYALCTKYDIVIIEDDPYWYLQYPTATALNANSPPSSSSDLPIFATGEPLPSNWKPTGYPFLDSLAPSYVSIDADGRVVRLDTFSKTIAPGCRLGWITAQPELIERFLCISETTSAQPSGFVQSLVAELLLGPNQHGIAKKSGDGRGGLPNGEGWKADGWVRWLEGLRGNYERRMNRMSRVLEANRFLVHDDDDDDAGKSSGAEDAGRGEEGGWAVVERTQMYEFQWPMGGMFLWLHVKFENHPLYDDYRAEGVDGLARLSRALWLLWTTVPYLVLVGQGQIFCTTEELKRDEGWKFFRLCFAAIDDAEIVPSSQRLADGVAAFWRIKDRKVIEKIIDDDAKSPEETSGLTQMSVMMGPC